MYDYIEVYGNEDYSEYLSIEDFRKLFVNRLDIEQNSNASFTWTHQKHKFLIQGIACDQNGNYSFDSDQEFQRINLIEINIPQGAESLYDKEIRAFVIGIATKTSWKINWRE